MSYLPRMSKTYKEPQEAVAEDFEEILSGTTLKPASSLLNEKTHNPQMVLKHYKYFPHAPPVLPGPSVVDEAVENELYREASRMKRLTNKVKSISNSVETVKEEPMVEESKVTIMENESKVEVSEKVKRTHSKKTIKGSKTSVGRKKSVKNVKKDNPSAMINVCLTGTDIGKPFTALTSGADSRGDPDLLSKEELNFLKRQKSVLPVSVDDFSVKSQKLTDTSCQVLDEPETDELEINLKKFSTRSVQCTIFGSLKKFFVIPSVIHSLLRTLAFLLHELSKEEALSSTSGDKKSLLTQIQLLLGDLCNQKVDKEYSFETTYSDFKRLEKIVGELQKYMKDIYGDKGEYIDKMEDLRRVFIDLKKKEMELAVLSEKLQEKEEKSEAELLLKESDLKNPEITLQNKRLESEQLAAEVEFSYRELTSIQKTMAELDWDIRNFQEQLTSLKKSVTSKSRIEVVGKKCSVPKFFGELLPKGSKSKENDSSIKKKT